MFGDLYALIDKRSGLRILFLFILLRFISSLQSITRLGSYFIFGRLLLIRLFYIIRWELVLSEGLSAKITWNVNLNSFVITDFGFSIVKTTSRSLSLDFFD